MAPSHFTTLIVSFLVAQCLCYHRALASSSPHTTSSNENELVVVIKWENVNSVTTLTDEQQASAVAVVSNLLTERMTVNVSRTSFRPTLGLTPHGHMNTLATLKIKHSRHVHQHSNGRSLLEDTKDVKQAQDGKEEETDLDFNVMSTEAIRVLREADLDSSLRHLISQSLSLDTIASTKNNNKRRLQGYTGWNQPPTVSAVLVEENVKLELFKAIRINKRFRPRFYFDGSAQELVQEAAVWHLDRINQVSLPLDSNFNRPSLFEAPPTAPWVYIVDTGIMINHAELNGRTTTIFNNNPEEPDVCHTHGTHVAALAAGSTVGVAPTAQVFNVKTLDCEGSTYTSGLIAAVSAIIQHCTANGGKAARGVTVNFSLGGAGNPAAPGNAPFADQLAQLREQCDAAIVAAAGNSAEDACMFIPGGYKLNSQGGVISVGASSTTDTLASFSNRGPCVNVNAPGVNIVSAGICSTTCYVSLSGTSMAAPVVAGYAAVQMAHKPSDWHTLYPSALFADNVKAKLLSDSNLKIKPSAASTTTSRLLFANNVVITTDTVLAPVAPAGAAPGTSNASRVRPATVVIMAIWLVCAAFIILQLVDSASVQVGGNDNRKLPLRRHWE